MIHLEMKMAFGVYLLVLAQFFSHSHGAGILEVRLVSFVNEGWRDVLGSCCGESSPSNGDTGPTSTCTTPCTPFFRICLKQWQNPVQPEGPCYYGSRVTEVFNGNTASDPLSPGAVLRVDLAHSAGYQEPIKFPFSFSWTGTMSLIVEAWHGSSNSSQAITTTSSADVQSPTTGKQLLLRVAELRELKVGFEWTQESHSNNYSRFELQYRVVCEQHYYGDDCTHFCRPRDDQYGHYLCTANGTRVCVNGWTGSMCNRAICAPGCHPENGACTVPGQCECTLGYQGPLCEQCVRYPGCVHGTCTKAFECQCDEGWGGLFCNQDLNFCTHHKPCLNGATCTNTGSGHYTCQCRPGFTGVNCENRIETCAQTPCLNGGTCTQSTSNYTCHCPAGYSGRHCQSNARTCEDGPCENGATCSDAPGGGYQCVCAPGYEGANCDVERDECAEGNPCLNGGTCINRRASASVNSLSSPNFYQCSCPTGFTGPRCETNINDCTVQPCLNGGTCVDLIGSFKCECAPGFAGMLCQQNIDDCLKRPCANGGTCFDGINDFRCMCRPGFRGKDCSIDINECESNPCRNGGTCTDSIDAYQCRCPPCFAGVNCEQRNDDCIASGDHWPKPDYFVPYNVSGVPVPSLFHVGSASGRTETSTDTQTSHSVLAIGVPVLVVFSVIMVILIAVVTCLYRKTKRQASASNSTTDVSRSTDLEACKRQNEWNERRALQMCNNNFNPNYVAKLDNRSVENASEVAKGYSKAKRLDPCSSPLHSPKSYSDHDKNLNSVQPNYYKIVSVDKLDFSNDDRRSNGNVERPLSFMEGVTIGQRSDSGLCTPISCGDEERRDDIVVQDETQSRHSKHPVVRESCSFDSGLAVGSPVSEREVVVAADDCPQQQQQQQPRQSSVADIQVTSFKSSSSSSPASAGGRQQRRQQPQQQMHRHHHFGQNHQRPHNRSSSINDNSNSLHSFTGETMLVMEERTPGAPVSHV